MERTTRILERAPVDRDARVAVLQPVHHAVADTSVEFTDTVMYRTPQVSIDPVWRDNQRILPPGASGANGSAYKMLRTQVLKRLDQLGGNTLGVLSAASGEGKTLTAINLAIAIAADPARTALLVDFDLRNPSVHRRFGHTPEVGIEECLQTSRPLRDAMFKVAGYERLTIAAARERCEISSELLASQRAAELVNEMRVRYANRIVIFDVPPVLLADDALVFARHLQAGLLVISEGKTRREEVGRTLGLLSDLPFVGTVLNGVKGATGHAY